MVCELQMNVSNLAHQVVCAILINSSHLLGEGGMYIFTQFNSENVLCHSNTHELISFFGFKPHD